MWLTFFFFFHLKNVEKRSIKLCKISSINKPVSSIASMSITYPSPDLTWERGGGRARLGSHRETSMGRERARPPIPSVLPRNHAGAEVLGACLAGWASSDTRGPQPSLKSACSTWKPSSILLANSIHIYIYVYVYTHIKKTTEESIMIVTRRMQAPTNHSSPWRHPLTAHCLQPAAHCPASPQDPGSAGPSSSPTGRHSTQPAPSLTQGSPWHRQTWRGPLGGLRGPGLSILSLLPLIS